LIIVGDIFAFFFGRRGNISIFLSKCSRRNLISSFDSPFLVFVNFLRGLTVGAGLLLKSLGFMAMKLACPSAPTTVQVSSSLMMRSDMSKFSYGLRFQLWTEGLKPSEATMLEERLELDVGELDVEKVEEEACLFKGKDLPEDGTFLQGSL
jgi:hypothetical protein